MLSGLNTSFLGNLGKKIEEETKEIVKNANKDTFIIKINNKKYDVMYSIFHIISRVVTDNNILISVGGNLDNKTLEKLTNKLLGHLKTTNKQSRSSKTRYNNRLNTMELKISRDILINPYLELIELLHESADEEHQINLAMISESVQAAVGITWAVKDDKRFVNYIIIHTLILYYWAYKNYTCIREEVDKYNNAGMAKQLFTKARGVQLFKLAIGDEESTEDFLNERYNNSRISDFISKYTKDCELDRIGYAEYNLLEDMIDIIKYQKEINKAVNNTIENTKSSLRDKNMGRFGLKLASGITDSIGMSKEDLCIISSINNITHYSTPEYDAGIVFSYLYKITPISDKHYEYIYDLLATTIHVRREYVHLVELSISAAHCMGATKTLTDHIEKAAKTQVKLETLTSNNDKLKAEVRELKKTIRGSQDEINKLQLEIQGYISKDKLGLSIKEIEAMRDKIKSLEESLDKSNDLHDTKNRQLNKKDRKVGELEDRIKTLEQKNVELQEKYDKAIEDNKSKEILNKYNNIPIECFVNAIRNKNIVIIGGDNVFSKLSEYKFDSLKTITSSVNSIKTEELLGADIIVLMVKFMSNTTYYSALGIAKVNNIKTIQCNNTNTDIIIYSIFEALNK